MVEHFVSTQRKDRTGIDRSTRKQTDPVIYEMVLNADAIMTISHVRLCNCADKATIQVWRNVIKELWKINEPLARCCVPKCIYQGYCYEHKSCNFHHSSKFNDELEKYREGINVNL